MLERANHKCDRCGEWKLGPEPGTSYFTDLMWFCDDCKYEQAVDSGKNEMSTIVADLMEKNK